MKKGLFIVSIISATALVAGGVSFLSLYNKEFKKAEAVEGTFVPSTTLPDSYVVNSEFTVPNGVISYDGQEYQYNDYYLKYPNGRSYKKDSYLTHLDSRFLLASFSLLFLFYILNINL